MLYSANTNTTREEVAIFDKELILKYSESLIGCNCKRVGINRYIISKNEYTPNVDARTIKQVEEDKLCIRPKFFWETGSILSFIFYLQEVIRDKKISIKHFDLESHTFKFLLNHEYNERDVLNQTLRNLKKYILDPICYSSEYSIEGDTIDLVVRLRSDRVDG